VRRIGVWALLAVLPAAAAAQVTVRVSAGARATTTLVRDSIVTGFDIRPALAPTIAVAFELPEHRGWSPGVMLDASWSALRRHEAGGTADLGGLTTFAFTVGLRRTLPGGVSAAVRVGGLQYLPGREAGLFRDGGGSPVPVAGVAARFAPPAAGRFALEARYDLHRFTTSALQDAGMSGGRTVHRFALVVAADVSSLR
jgi:hypothetical protein